MRPPDYFGRTLLLTALLAAGGTRPLAAAGDDLPARLEYARDERTELTLEPYDSPDKFAFDLRVYGGPAEGQTVYFMGDLKRTSGEGWEISVDTGKNLAKLRVTGKPAAHTPLAIQGDALKAAAEKAMMVEGEYRPISSEERLARAQKRYALCDDELNRAYVKARSELGSPRSLTHIRDSQRAWISDRDSYAEWEAHDPDHPKAQPAYWEMLLAMTAERVTFLRAYSGVGVPKGLEGGYSDGAGGTLEIHQLKNGDLRFSLTAVRGPSHHNGEIEGVAHLQGSVASYKELIPKAERGSDRKPAEITFTFRGGHIAAIKEKNIDYWAGAGVSFEGDYFKKSTSP